MKEYLERQRRIILIKTHLKHREDEEVDNVWHSGFFGREATWREDIETMNKRMRHRGPDAQVYWYNDCGGVTLGHVRLSILDLTEAGS